MTDPRTSATLLPASPLVQRVQHQIRARIAAGEYAANARLPGEHELAATHGVSRPVVREALRRLREDGLVFSRQGAGTFVRGEVAHNTLGFARIETIADIQRCFEFRLSFEPDAAAHAASRRSEAALVSMEAAIEGLLDATRRLQHRDDIDFAFHRAVAQAANNHYYSQSLDALQDHIAVGMKLHGLSLMNAGPKLENVFGEHVAVFDAIRNRAPEAAARAMRDHLVSSRDRLFEGRLLDLAASSPVLVPEGRD